MKTIYYSTENPLSNQLEKITGDAYGTDYKKQYTESEHIWILIHVPTGQKFECVNRQIVRVELADGNSFTTEINGTRQQVRDYYRIGNLFNVGWAGELLEDNMQAVKNLVFLSFMLIFMCLTTSCSTVQPQQQIIEEEENTTPPPVNVPFTAVFVTNDCKHVRDTVVTFKFTAADSLTITEDYGGNYLIWTDKTGKKEVTVNGNTIVEVNIYPSVDADLYYEKYFTSSKMKKYYETNPQLRH